MAATTQILPDIQDPVTGERVSYSPGNRERYNAIKQKIATLEQSNRLGARDALANGTPGGNDPYSPNYVAPPGESDISLNSRALTGSYLRDFPAILQQIRREIPKFEQQQYGLAAQYSPQYAALQREIFRKNQQAAEGANLASLERFGTGITNKNLELDKLLNPEYYQDRAVTGDQLRELISGGLSGSELTAIERGNNRQFETEGTAALPIRSKEVESAINFGEAGRNRLTQALQTATQVLPTLRSPVAPYTPNKPTDISGSFQNVQTDLGQSTKDLARYNPAEGATQLKVADITKPRKNDSFNLGLSL